MGKSKSSVGIKIVDDLVDSAINKGTNAVAKNVERNAQNVAQGAGLMVNGKWNNLDRTLLDMAISGTGFGMMVNPDDVGRSTGKQTAVQRMQAEATTAAEQQAAADAAAREAIAVDGVRSTISGQIGARMRAPGRGVTLLSDGAGRANTLLTVAGG